MPHPFAPPARGEIYWFDPPAGVGSEQRGFRPGVIISLDGFNRRMNTVLLVPCTTTVRDADRAGQSPITLYLPAGEPLEQEGCVLAFQVITIDKQRLSRYAAVLSAEQMAQLDRRLAVAFGLANTL